jgi:hypothetical protein
MRSRSLRRAFSSLLATSLLFLAFTKASTMAEAQVPRWVQSYPQRGASGCVEYVARWSDGTYTATLWDCPPGKVAHLGALSARQGYMEIAPNGCTEYITEWSDTVYTSVPVTCPPGVVYYKLPTSPSPILTPAEPPASGCDPSYPTLCLTESPNLDCDDILARDFPVLPPDSHNFDADHNGVGCEANSTDVTGRYGY